MTVWEIRNIYNILKKHEENAFKEYKECKERLRNKYGTDWTDDYTPEELEEFESKRNKKRDAYDALRCYRNLDIVQDVSREKSTCVKRIPTEELVEELFDRDEARLIVKCFPKDCGMINRGINFEDDHFYKNDMLIAINTEVQHG